MYFFVHDSEVPLMSRCDSCSKPCGCAVAQNGAAIVVENSNVFIGDASLFPTERVGWRDNIVEGTGSVNDPYSVSFKDALEFRPRAQEWRQIGGNYEDVGWVSEPTLYSTPTENALFIFNVDFPSVNVVGTGFMVGAYADVNTFGVSTPIELHLFYDFVVTSSGPGHIGGATTQAANPVLACVGYVSPLRSALNIVSSGLTLSIALDVRFPGVSDIDINSVRIWAVEV